MADCLQRTQLARAASALGRARRSTLPALVLLTDDERLPEPRDAVMALPRGSLVILRARERKRCSALADMLAGLACAHGLEWIVADDPDLAARAGADGAHFPERKVSLAAHWRVRRPNWLITCAAHSLGACLRAARAGANAVLLAPVFATASHADRPGIGSLRARLIARDVPVPIFALGGIDAQTAGRLAGGSFAGLAAIGGLAVPRRDGSCCTGDTANV